MLSDKLLEIYNLLFVRYGPQHWWPGQGSFETIIGAILTQNTNWKNVEKAIANLRTAGLLEARRLHETPLETLAELIRPAGYYNIKARRLKNFLDRLFDNFDGSIDSANHLPTTELRQQLLSIRGIGPETADSILLYAFDRAVFVVDAYTCRVLARHGLIDTDVDYESIRSLFEDNLPADTALFNEYHALIVRVGKEHCRRKALCSGCPLDCLGHDLELQA